MLSKPTGIGQGASDQHADVFEDLAANAAREVSELFQKQFDVEVLTAEHANEPVCVYFQLGGEDEADVGEVLDHAVKARQAGYRMEAEELSEKTGYELKEVSGVQPSAGDEPEDDPTAEEKRRKGEEERAVVNRLINRDADNQAQARVLRAAFAADLQPFLSRLDLILEIEDEAIRKAKLQAFLADYESLKADLLADPTAAQVLSGIISSAFARGVREEQPRMDTDTHGS